MSTMSHDVVVLGTGAAGLVAALAAHDRGAHVGLYEKGAVVGGTTALSGGIVWIPNNHHAAAAGLSDSREDALAYLDSLSLGAIDPALATTLIDTGPEVVRWLEATTPLRLRVVKGYPDYHPEHPGGKPGGGRSLDPDLFDYVELGPWADRVARPPSLPRLTLIEIPLGGGSGEIDPADMAERDQRDSRGRGQALAGALLRACLDRGIEPVTGARAIELIRQDGRVAGVRFAPAGPVDDVAARRGVVIATGGFEWEPTLVRAFLRGPMTSPTTIPTNTGDGLRMALSAGAAVGAMAEAWWVPTLEIPGETLYGRPRARLVLRERTLPRSILVNRRGRRFANEAANYNALGGAFHQFDPSRFEYANLPCWLVFDHGYLVRYGLLDVEPDGALPSWLSTAASLDELAERNGVDAAGLVATVARWNELVQRGHDDDFGRGDSAYDGWSGDQRFLGSPQATMGPIDEPPYYAVEIHSGTLGTKGGPRTDVDGRVLDFDGRAIDGLYAAGNAMAAATGLVYGGAGGTLGPAVVFGYRAGRDAATRDRPA
jgi:succinate dehydrogenase/fumarate reductase flavoprotein subunit